VRLSIQELSLHASKEEMVLYENFRKNDLIPNGKDVAEHGWNEHEETKKLLYDLDMKLKPTDPQYDSTFKQVITMMRRHMAEEEQEILPELEKHCDNEKLKELGRSYISHETIAVTRPHPSAPDKGILGKIANATAKPMDALRDKLNPPSSTSESSTSEPYSSTSSSSSSHSNTPF